MQHYLEKYIAEIPDYPKKGVLFRDISPLLREKFPELITEMAALLHDDIWEKVDYIAGIEARGFGLASALAILKNKGFLPIRKKGKLPGKVASKAYSLEYGEDALEMHYGNGGIILVDDVLATGGTLQAAAHLCNETGHILHGLLTIIDLQYLNNFTYEGMNVKSLLKYK